MNSKRVIHYEELHFKINSKWKTNIEIKRGHCYGEYQYIKNFTEFMKENVIRNLPDLNKVNIILSVFDKNNIIHSLMVFSLQMLCKILNIHREINLYKSIIVTIKYEDNIVFNGNISFDGIL